MYSYFYNFHNKPLANDLFNRDNEDGTPSPPESQERLTEQGVPRDTQNGILRITE